MNVCCMNVFLFTAGWLSFSSSQDGAALQGPQRRDSVHPCDQGSRLHRSLGHCRHHGRPQDSCPAQASPGFGGPGRFSAGEKNKNFQGSFRSDASLIFSVVVVYIFCCRMHHALILVETSGSIRIRGKT